MIDWALCVGNDFMFCTIISLLICLVEMALKGRFKLFIITCVSFAGSLSYINQLKAYIE